MSTLPTVTSIPGSRDIDARRALRWALLLALVAGLPALTLGFLFDDWSLRAGWEGLMPGPARHLDLYRFVDGEGDSVRRMIERGPFPWWMAPHLKLACFRPLAAALFGFDHDLLGASAAAAHHAHSLLWYLAFVVAGGLLLRRALGDRAPLALALALFAVNESHVMPLAWLSNRHALVAGTLVFAGIAAHVRWRERGWRPGAPLSLLAFALGLLAGEMAVAALAYLVAWELAGRPPSVSWRSRVAALGPATLLLALYLALYHALGYGGRSSGTYVDVANEPLVFLREAPLRMLALIGSFFTGPSVDLAGAMPSLMVPFAAAGLLSLVAIGALLRRAGRDLPEETKRGLRWLGLGALISLLPVAGAQIGSRLQLVASLGGVAVVAVIVEWAWRAAKASAVGPRRRRLRVLLGALVALEVLRPPITLAVTLEAMRRLGAETLRVARESELPVAPEAGNVAVVLPAVADPMAAMYAPVVRLYQPGVASRAWWPLSYAAHDHEMWRTADDTLELRVIGGRMLEGIAEQLLRSPSLPLAVGDTVMLDGLRVRVLEVEGGGPVRIEARFDRSLDDSHLWFVELRGGILRRLHLPRVGERVVLRHERGPMGL